MQKAYGYIDENGEVVVTKPSKKFAANQKIAIVPVDEAEFALELEEDGLPSSATQLKALERFFAAIDAIEDEPLDDVLDFIRNNRFTLRRGEA